SCTKYEYFYYNVGMLPEGRYYIDSYRHSFEWNSWYEKRFTKDEKKYYFDIKAGQVNYLGDLYMAHTGRTEGGFLTTKKHYTQHMLANKIGFAKDYMKDYYPSIKWPFRTALIKMEK